MSNSPTVRLLLGLLITLLAVAGFSWYALRQVSGLRKLQSQMVDVNRHDSLLLLQVQNDLNAVGLELRDMVRLPKKKLTEFRADFEKLQSDLRESIRDEARLSPVTRMRDREKDLQHSLEHFRETSDELFRLSEMGQEDDARTLITSQLAPQQFALSTLVLHLLERNNEAEERADKKIAAIYDGTERNIYLFLAAMMIAIVVTSSYLTYSNRQIFYKLESLSKQRRVLAARLITVQEEVLRSVSRELHDEFGQILTAVATMLARAERKGLPAESPLRAELGEIREITHNTLEKMRSLSQMLHPAVLDDYGLEKGISWYTEVFQRQAGIKTEFVVEGRPTRITGQAAINCFRIVQEALNNAAKHSGTKRAEVRMQFGPRDLTVHVTDFGQGFALAKKNDKLGLGLIAMRERADLLNGSLNVSSAPGAGTTIAIKMPLEQNESLPDTGADQRIGEVLKPLL